MTPRTRLFYLFSAPVKSTCWYFATGGVHRSKSNLFKDSRSAFNCLKHDATSWLQEARSRYSDPASCLPIGPGEQSYVTLKRSSNRSLVTGSGGLISVEHILRTQELRRHCVLSGASQRGAAGCTLCLDSTVQLVRKNNARGHGRRWVQNVLYQWQHTVNSKGVNNFSDKEVCRGCFQHLQVDAGT